MEIFLIVLIFFLQYTQPYVFLSMCEYSFVTKVIYDTHWEAVAATAKGEGAESAATRTSGRHSPRHCLTARKWRAGVPIRAGGNAPGAGVRSGERLRVETARKIANALGVTMDYLCGVHEEQEDSESLTVAVG